MTTDTDIAASARTQRKFFGLNPNVVILGIVSLLTDISSEMIFTLVPLFLTNVLGARTSIVGLVGGISDSTDAVFKIFSGWFSDRAGKRKPLAVLGYSLSTFTKPFMLLASNWGLVTAIRFSDRVGKGFRTAPRDALVADSISKEQRGKAFGLHRAMDTAGAVLGLAIAALIIYLTEGDASTLSPVAYKWMIIIGTIPAVLAVVVLVSLVREAKAKTTASTDQGRRVTALWAGFDNRFKLFLVVIAVFTLGRSSDFFLILRAQNLGAPVLHITLMLVLFNVTYSAISIPAGMLSDKLGRGRVIMLGWVVYAGVYAGFALANSMWQVWLLFAVFGIYYGITEGVGRAMVADLVPVEKGTAYGLYHGVLAATLLPASLIAGWLWQAVSPASVFFFGAGMALLALICFLVLIRDIC